jgi:carbamate kinase
MRIVVALGGNALLRRGESADAEVQRRNVEVAARGIAELAGEHQVVVTHGNGPQVGLLSLTSESYQEVTPYPLDVLGAESEGMIGYMLEIAIRNALPGRPLATVLTEVLVQSDDPAFTAPSKPIGPGYTREQAERLARERGWTVRADGDSYRRVVPSPEPQAILALDVIRPLVASTDKALVVCAGGGGVPVTRDADGRLHGTEAVIDKDLTASLLASELDADLLLMLTDVSAVELDWGTPQARPLTQTTPSELERYDFASGSMGPKVEAARRFASRGGRAAIGELANAEAIVRGRAGTQVLPEHRNAGDEADARSSIRTKGSK